MGIKFHCPNGHKLNVKSFLSGKRAICPKCGVSVLVPTVDPAEADADSSSRDSASATANTISWAPSATETPPVAPGIPSPPPLHPADAIAEAPGALWYVRPATGGQFGPASGEIMRSWLNEGRVSGSSLLWRAGWPEWRAAAAVFPQLSGLAPAPAALPSATMTVPPTAGLGASVNGPPPIGGSLPVGHVVQSIPPGRPVGSPAIGGVELPPLAQSVRRKRRQHDRRLYATAALVCVSVILLIVLLFVFRRQGQPTEPATPEAKPAAEPTLE